MGGGENNGWLDGSDDDDGKSLGADREFRGARNFALTPYVNYLNQFGGSYTYSGGGATGLEAAVHLFPFGLGFTWF